MSGSWLVLAVKASGDDTSIAWILGIAIGFWVLVFTYLGYGRLQAAIADRRTRHQHEERRRLAEIPGTVEYEQRQAVLREAEDNRREREEAARRRLEEIERAGITDWQSAEKAMLRAMKAMGFADARLTKRGADMGIDIRASGAAAQVKHFAAGGKIGRPAIQQLKGAAGARTKALFFAFGSRPYTKEAFTWASQHAVALFTYDATGQTRPVNDVAAVIAGAPTRAHRDRQPGRT